MADDMRAEIERRMDNGITTADELQAAIEDIIDGEVRFTDHGNEVTFDFKLPVAEDAPFASSMTYNPDENTITGTALRFSPDVLERLPDARVQERLEGVIERTDPPDGTLWGTYIRGDAQITGPHILAPGGFSNIDPDEFIEWLPEVIDEWRETF